MKSLRNKRKKMHGNKAARAYQEKCRALLKKDPASVLQALPGAPLMGFDRLDLDLQDEGKVKYLDTLRKKIQHQSGYKPGFFQELQLGLAMMPFGRSMLEGIKKQFTELSQNDTIIENELEQNRDSLWQELNEFASKKCDIHKIGFTKLNQELIFKNCFILYRYALVLVQEMKYDRIKTAPEITSTKEVMRIYMELGLSANRIAGWLRQHNIKAQSIHPIGGLVNTPPLAGKAGLGWLGRNGCLITPEFGPRQRITVVLIEKPIFRLTDSRQHTWIENFCADCGKCIKSCPAQAIQPRKTAYGEELEGLGRLYNCIDYLKCYSFFEPTGGCSICLKVCPFSRENGIYHRLKKKYQHKQEKKIS